MILRWLAPVCRIFSGRRFWPNSNVNTAVALIPALISVAEDVMVIYQEMSYRSNSELCKMPLKIVFPQKQVR